ncbi:MAG: esterase family protein [Mycobacteriaceae bacterium]|nr:esterase family protein [Mycobacteriaceae bacterium]
MRFPMSLAARVFALTVAVSGMAAVGGQEQAHADNTLVTVHSAAMNRDIPVRILKAAGAGPAPTLYLLDGLRAPDNNNGWLINTDVVNFFANKHVNVAIPFGGGGTFYSDWVNDDPKLGHVRWETFLTRELPNVMRSKFGSDGVNNAIAGLSMSGTSALSLAERHPGLYKAVVSLSGYPTAMAPAFAQGIQVSVAQMGGDSNNMWGAWPSSEWVQHDPLVNAHKLHGTKVYISAGTGLPGAADGAVNPLDPKFDPVRFIQLVPLETMAGLSTLPFALAAMSSGADTKVHLNETGIHWWNHWQNRLHEAWYETIKPAIGG